MEINTERIKDLVISFSKLNEKYQKKALLNIYELQEEQQIEEEYDKEMAEAGKVPNQRLKKEEIEARKLKRNSELFELLKSMKGLTQTQIGGIAMFLEKEVPGAFTRDDEITITINSKKMNLDEYLHRSLPDADLNESKHLLDEIMRSIEENRIQSKAKDS